MGPKRKRFDSYNTLSHQLDPSSKDKVEKIFKKKFSYSTLRHKTLRLRCQGNKQTQGKQGDEGRKLMVSDDKSKTEHQETCEASMQKPADLEDNEELCWKVQDLISLKEDLNTLKDELSDKDVLEWHKHTCFTNLAGGVVQELKQVFHAELCTQAWGKFFEIVSTFTLVPLTTEVFNSVHLCEAPGAFIAALNHFLMSQAFSGTWSWLGTTLSPYYEGNSLVQMIDDDRFIRSTLDNWYFGEDGTGNIMDYENLQGLKDRTQHMGDVQLVTADGSIDCQNTPAEQEVVVSRLHYCEVLTALHILSPGGAFVVKLFTMFESSTVCLMYLLCSQFEQVNVFKPPTSKSGNSEVYTVCLGYRKQMKGHALETLCRHFFSETAAEEIPIFEKADIPSSFLQEHIECCRFFTKHQSDTIRGNLHLYGDFSPDQRTRMQAMKDYCTELFVNTYNVNTIPGYMKITHQSHKKYASKFEIISSSGKQGSAYDKPVTQRIHSGSFKCRVEQSQLPWRQRVQLLEKLDLKDASLSLECTDPLHPAEINYWTVGKGRPLLRVISSRLCDGYLTKQMNTVLDNAQLTSDSDPGVCYKEVARVISELLSQRCESISANNQQVALMVADDDLHLYLQEHLPYRCSTLDNIGDMHISDSGNAVVVLSVCDVTMETGGEELAVRRKFLSRLIQVLKVMPEGGHLVLHLHTSLTLFTAGLLYILARMFSQVSMCPQLPGVWLQQVLYFEGFGDLHPSVLTYLESVDSQMSGHTSQDMEVLEVLPKTIIINDVVFTRFMLSVNRSFIGNFVNAVIDAERARLSDGESEPNTSS
ncbi:cap-specific mRNA (nucleoside-2'-O-)-methyltransferase 2-like [Haliotis rufescens]|uniref:cap-specific mRNA (nucleoside-2'-O-)-methyltransferase 2-like n=1 Tax=Haliotis rufescens TaxID=6454 RepID=UPI00201F3EA9|nr:cap-specific mRNA (nucleoside-2'-O-)-methyltransferase 2-like [Haliotis rufescens]XP_046365873.2 cap-specific mRNA (nucleoside-2'-O-)-methyltransferase 2-like [Haliotis rufescens]XP_048244956.1 cap-specific mRNA (nucleoside-2'-O-)-methyltransferase 2-like [Haliotis rufescens]